MKCRGWLAYLIHSTAAFVALLGLKLIFRIRQTGHSGSRQQLLILHLSRDLCAFQLLVRGLFVIFLRKNVYQVEHWLLFYLA